MGFFYQVEYPHYVTGFDSHDSLLDVELLRVVVYLQLKDRHEFVVLADLVQPVVVILL